MDSFYLLDYLKENCQLNEVTFDLLKYEFDKRIYYYGEQFKHPFEGNNKGIYLFLRKYLKAIFINYTILTNKIANCERGNILSSAYFSVNSELNKIGYSVYCPPWSISRDRNIYPDSEVYFHGRKLKNFLLHACFSDLLGMEFLEILKNFEQLLASSLRRNNIKAIIVANDIAFFENLLIKICKEINIPSFIFLHGLPGRYNDLDDNQTDYLVVWGDKIKENYITHGIAPSKIIVAGHPFYQQLGRKPLKFSLDKILVVTKAMSGAQFRDKTRISDRGNSILYLLSIEKVLRKHGIKRVRLRVHPSESAKWYEKFINTNFFEIDNLPLQESIAYSSMVLGPTSTVFLESIYFGKNYLVYEPAIDSVDVFNYRLIPPFDKSDMRIPVATDEDELDFLLRNKSVVESSILSEYIRTPFNPNFIDQII